MAKRPDAILCGIRWSDDDRARALRLHADGVLLDRIVAAIGCSRTTLRRWLNKARAPSRRRGFRPQRPELTAEVCSQLWREHGSFHKAARAADVSASTIYNRATGRSEVWT